LREENQAVVDAVQRISESWNLPMAQIALAWVERNPAVSAPIIGATKVIHLDDAVASLDLELSPDEVASLDQHYVIRDPEALVAALR
jgi:1-deoxyxylulose-5-phosphate synthase